MPHGYEVPTEAEVDVPKGTLVPLPTPGLPGTRSRGRVGQRFEIYPDVNQARLACREPTNQGEGERRRQCEASRGSLSRPHLGSSKSGIFFAARRYVSLSCGRLPHSLPFGGLHV